MNSNSQEEFDIVKLIELSRYKKYETTVAGFGALDKIDKLDIPKKLKSRKIAVQALHALSENLIQYDYISAEEKQQVEEKTSDTDENKKNLDALFSSPAPVVEEDTEEDELPQDEEKSQASDEDGDYSDDFEDDASFEDDEEK
ncbi:MAG: DNA primase [Spirochaetota bacterium]